jgi:FlaA1/EpsC-like NDP-sugar epimerase
MTMGHAVCMAAHAALLAADRALLAAPADPVTLTVGELASRIWRQAGCPGEPELDLLGTRRGETMNEVLIRPGEELDGEPYQGIAPIRAEIPTAGAAWVVERLTEAGDRAGAERTVWLEAMRRPGLLDPGHPEAARRPPG